MPKTQLDNEKLLIDITTILSNLKNDLKDIYTIKKRIFEEDEIRSFKEGFCKQCKEPCGRSNAEIYRCMMKKMKKENTPQQYTKEQLEHDIQELIQHLEKNEKQLTYIMEKIQKAN